METRTCPVCGNLFLPRPQNPNQYYCSKKSCQRERRSRWQQTKRETDKDYRDNLKRSQRDWRARNPQYWREYRNSHPSYAAKNRAQQLVRNYRNRSVLIAKMDASIDTKPLSGGLYQLRLISDGLIAKKNAWIVFLSPYGRNAPMHVP